MVHLMFENGATVTDVSQFVNNAVLVMPEKEKKNFLANMGDISKKNKGKQSSLWEVCKFIYLAMKGLDKREKKNFLVS